MWTSICFEDIIDKCFVRCLGYILDIIPRPRIERPDSCSSIARDDWIVTYLKRQTECMFTDLTKYDTCRSAVNKRQHFDQTMRRMEVYKMN